MSVLLEPPSTVLVAGPAGPPDDPLRAALLDGAASAVRSAPDAASAGEAAADDDVACVVVAGTLSASEVASVCAAVRDADEDLPVVFRGESDGEGPVADLLFGLGATVVPRSAPVERLREAVDDALATYRRRRTRAEESEMLRAMLGQLGKSIYFKDEAGRIVHHADVGGGPDPEEARGKTDPEIYDGEWTDEAHELELRLMAEGKKLVDAEEYVPESDLWMRTTKVPWRDDDGEVRGLIGITTDVTKYKRRERELDELQRRFDSFVHQLRHDLKTQLQIAVGNLEARESDDERLAAIQRSLAEIDRIVEDYGQLANRSIDVDRTGGPTELCETARTAWSAVESGDATLEVDAESGTYVNAPRAMSLVVLENLFRETADGGRVSTVRVGTTDDGFYVEDTGSGVSDPKLELLEQDGYATAKDGSGHELSLVKEEIDRHVWTLSVGESPEGGARFEVGNCLIDAVGLGDGRPVDLEAGRAVGDLEAGGEAEYDAEADRWRVRADGTDVFRQDNDFYFVSTTAEGDVSLRAKLARLERVADMSKAGLMVRQSPSERAPYGYVGATPTRGTELLWRPETGADGRSRHLKEEAVPFDWYRLDRVGDEVTMSVSLDGERWQRVDRRAVATDDPVHVGLAVCSTVAGERCEALFESVEIREGSVE